MSGKLLWTGLTLVVAVPDFMGIPFKLAGAVLMVVGTVMLWLDR